jgi:hypothetical protein
VFFAFFRGHFNPDPLGAFVSWWRTLSAFAPFARHHLSFPFMFMYMVFAFSDVVNIMLPPPFASPERRNFPYQPPTPTRYSPTSGAFVKSMSSRARY